jgi:hypothetical protein
MDECGTHVKNIAKAMPRSSDEQDVGPVSKEEAFLKNA